MSDTRIDLSAPAELRKWPSLNKQRVSASLGARPYTIGEGGTLEECIQQFMHLPDAQRHLYEIHTAPQSDVVHADSIGDAGKVEVNGAATSCVNDELIHAMAVAGLAGASAASAPLRSVAQAAARQTGGRYRVDPKTFPSIFSLALASAASAVAWVSVDQTLPPPT
jgi:hypothetical protein